MLLGNMGFPSLADIRHADSSSPFGGTSIGQTDALFRDLITEKRLLASAGRRPELHFGFPKPVQVAVGVNGHGFVLSEAKGGVRRIAGL